MLLLIIDDAWCVGMLALAPELEEVCMGTEGAVRVKREGVKEGV